MSYLVLRKYCLFEGILKQIVTVCILYINFITLIVVDTLVFSSSEGCQPYVLLGTHSSKQNIKSAAKQSLLNNNTTMANSGVDGRAARHMVWIWICSLQGFLTMWYTSSLLIWELTISMTFKVKRKRSC